MESSFRASVRPTRNCCNSNLVSTSRSPSPASSIPRPGRCHPFPSEVSPIHPTQLYSAVDGLILCLFLLAYYPYRRRDGEVIALLLSIYPITRFLIEMIRDDEGAVAGTGLTISQNLSLICLGIVGLLWLYILSQPRGTAVVPSSASS